MRRLNPGEMRAVTTAAPRMPSPTNTPTENARVRSFNGSRCGDRPYHRSIFWYDTGRILFTKAEFYKDQFCGRPVRPGLWRKCEISPIPAASGSAADCGVKDRLMGAGSGGGR
jgi:hypothetical protein